MIIPTLKDMKPAEQQAFLRRVGKQPKRTHRIADQVLLQLANGDATAGELAAAIHFTTHHVREKLRELVDAGRIHISERRASIAGAPFKVYRLGPAPIKPPPPERIVWPAPAARPASR